MGNQRAAPGIEADHDIARRGPAQVQAGDERDAEGVQRAVRQGHHQMGHATVQATPSPIARLTTFHLLIVSVAVLAVLATTNLSHIPLLA